MKSSYKDYGVNVYWGVATPKGEDDYKITRYPIQFQVKNMAKYLKGLPVHINHYTKDSNTGKPIKPSGQVLHAVYHEKNNKLYVFWVLYPTPEGNLAKMFLGGGDSNKFNEVTKSPYVMNELSLGYRIKETTHMIDGKPFTIPKEHEITELSICYEACRPDCKIKGCFPLHMFTAPNNLFTSGSLDPVLVDRMNQEINNLNNNNIKKEEDKKPTVIKKEDINNMGSKPLPLPENNKQNCYFNDIRAVSQTTYPRAFFRNQNLNVTTASLGNPYIETGASVS